MPENESPPPGLPKPGAAPRFEPTTSGADSALARARSRRTSRALSLALATLVLPVAAMFLLPSGTQDDSLRSARTPSAGPTPSLVEVVPPEATGTTSPDAAVPSAGTAAATGAPAPAGQAPSVAAPKQVAVGPAAGAGATDPSPSSSPDSGGTPDSKAGVDDRAKTLRLFLQTPGTAGAPGDSYSSGAAKYWRNRTVKGYRVTAEPFSAAQSAAGSACDAKAKEGFLITAAPQLAGEQVQACAGSNALVRGNGPYLSTGVTDDGLSRLNNYFTTSLTYKQQGKLVVEMAKRGNYLEPTNGKGWAVVISDTPNFIDAEEGFLAAMKSTGVPVKVIRTPKSGADSTRVASQLREGQYESVYFLGQPLFFIELTGKVGCPAYCPQWAGVGVSMGANSIGKPACQTTGGSYKGEFLSPYPGLDRAAELAPGVSFKDDVELSVYGSMQILDQMLKTVPGPSFDREGFIAALNGKAFPAGIFPEVNFRGGRFGGTQAYALRMDCSKGQHVTGGLY